MQHLYFSVSFSGCNGNNNRFSTVQACENACKHVSQQRKTEVICNLPILSGNCGEEPNATLPKWGYDNRQRRCIPFYYAGCEGRVETVPHIFKWASPLDFLAPLY